MTAGKTIRLSKLAREFNVGIHTIVEFLHKKGFDYDSNPNTKISVEAVELLEKEYKIDLNLKKESEKIILKSHRPKQEVISIDNEEELEEEELEEEEEEVEEEIEDKPPAEEPRKSKPSMAGEKKEEEKEEAPVEKPDREDNIKVVGKIDLDASKKAAKEEKETTEPKDKTKAEEKPEPPKEEQPEEIKAEKEQPQPEEPEEKVEKKKGKEEVKTKVDE